MDAGSDFWTGSIVRGLLGLHNFLIFASSAILVGLLSYLLHHSGYRGRHLIFEEVIAVITLFFYLIAIFLPIFKSYRGYMLPLNFVLTYLWITCLIFSSQDYSGNGCLFHTPPLFGRCGLKHAIQAFWIIGFVYLFFNTILEAMMWANAKLREGRRAGDAEKGATTMAGTTAGGTNSGAAATA